MRVLGWLHWLFTHRVEDAWQEGYSCAMDEADVTVEEKDAFIALQSAVILDCIEVFDTLGVWQQVPERLNEALADYA